MSRDECDYHRDPQPSTSSSASSSAPTATVSLPSGGTSINTVTKGFAGISPTPSLGVRLYSLLFVSIDGVLQAEEIDAKLETGLLDGGKNGARMTMRSACPANGLEFDPIPHAGTSKVFDVSILGPGGHAYKYLMIVVKAKLKHGVNSEAILTTVMETP